MHAHDTNYTVIKNGIVVVSGTGPAIRVDGNRLVIRDGPQETPPLRLTRAEAVRKLRHIIVCGQAGGFVTFDALRWLRDTGVAFSQLDWNGAVVIASGPRGPDQPDLRRAQALVCSGAVPKIADAITCETLRVKLSGQAQVAGLMGFSDASATISGFADAIAETDGKRALAIEAEAAWIYWNLWERKVCPPQPAAARTEWPVASWPARSVAYVRVQNFADKRKTLSGDDARKRFGQLSLRYSRIRNDGGAARARS